MSARAVRSFIEQLIKVAVLDTRATQAPVRLNVGTSDTIISLVQRMGLCAPGAVPSQRVCVVPGTLPALLGK